MAKTRVPFLKRFQHCFGTHPTEGIPKGPRPFGGVWGSAPAVNILKFFSETALKYGVLAAALSVASQVQARESALPDVNQPLRTGIKAPQDAAVVVSIEKYPLLDDSLAVPYATQDGDGIEHFLTYTVGVPMANLHRLQDKNATAAQIQEAFDAALTEARGGTVWFYFAGHGAASPEDRNQLVLGADTPMSERHMDEHAVVLRTLQEKIASSQVDRAVFIIDACSVSFGKRFAAPINLTLQASSKPIVIWSAASEGEKSGPLEKAQHGAFTYAALGALRGWADGELDGQKDGTVTSDEAHAFVKRFLKEQGVREQTPKMLSTRNHKLATRVKENAPAPTVAAEPSPPKESASGSSSGSKPSSQKEPAQQTLQPIGWDIDDESESKSTGRSKEKERHTEVHIDSDNLWRAILFTVLGGAGLGYGAYRYATEKNIIENPDATYSYLLMGGGGVLLLVGIPLWMESFYTTESYSLYLTPGGLSLHGQW